MTSVLDASAVLAFLQDEDGADVVEQYLADGSVISAVNWSEVVQKLRVRGADWEVAAALLHSYGLRVLDATSDDAVQAAARWTRGDGLSLGDRFCLALGHRLGATVVTADTAWGTDGVHHLRPVPRQRPVD